MTIIKNERRALMFMAIGTVILLLSMVSFVVAWIIVQPFAIGLKVTLPVELGAATLLAVWFLYKVWRGIFKTS